jgi:hypothetical protein
MNTSRTKAPISAVSDPYPLARRSIGLRFEAALEELIGMCHEGGMHPKDMVAALQYWADWAKANKR